jgi:hypothetical protein
MALPNQKITPIPNNEPDAVPSLWNTRYDEIDQNFSNLDDRTESVESEITTARGAKTSIGQRLDGLESTVGASSIDMQNARDAALKYAIEQAALANHGVLTLKEQAQQQGSITITNRGIVSGCAASKSTTATRNLNLTTGICFASGRSYSVAESTNAASVPSNSGASSVTVYAYLYRDAGGLWRLAVTPIGAAAPTDSIKIYAITIPANSTDATDPNLASVTLTDVRRIEALFPVVLDNPISVSVEINVLKSNDYTVDFDIVSAVGAPCETKSMVLSSRATNGFTVLLASAADNVVARWKISKLNN